MAVFPSKEYLMEWHIDLLERRINKLKEENNDLKDTIEIIKKLNESKE